ncbi:unnamed protein product, partial [Mesorhabditis spiculigera]
MAALRKEAEMRMLKNAGARRTVVVKVKQVELPPPPHYSRKGRLCKPVKFHGSVVTKTVRRMKKNPATDV